ncbi:hypothetical protein BD560DRAFT_387608 [Blakeslea trispora]|nr:hypothetical protein BD560DRAFT_387608 [Blakeslea trispora]
MILSTHSLQPSLKSPNELSELCSTVVKILCGGNLMWDMDRLMNFSLFCHRLVVELNLSTSVVYTSLKYFQSILANSINEYNIIDLSDIAHEYSLFTVSLILAYKFLEDNPLYMRQWSFVSMIPVEELVMLESRVLQKLDYSLAISTEHYHAWTDQCNTLLQMPYLSLEQLNLFDLHLTQSRLGCSMLLPVLLDDFYLLPSLSSSPQSTASYPDCYYHMTPTEYIPPSSSSLYPCDTLYQDPTILIAPTTVPSQHYMLDPLLEYPSSCVPFSWPYYQEEQMILDPMWYL